MSWFNGYCSCFQAKFLGNSTPPVFAVIARAVRVDQKLLGYQLAAYFDKPTARVQLIVSSIAEDDNLKICADGVLLSKHKVTVRLELVIPTCEISSY